jgi:hypothetical protein
MMRRYPNFDDVQKLHRARAQATEWPPFPGLSPVRPPTNAIEFYLFWSFRLEIQDFASAPQASRDRIAQTLAQQPPSAEVLAMFVSRSDIPEPMREYIAAVLLGQAKRPRGRPAGSGAALKLPDELSALLYRIARYKRVYERRKRRSGGLFKPYEVAVEKVSEETGIPVGTLDKWCYPR